MIRGPFSAESSGVMPDFDPSPRRVVPACVNAVQSGIDGRAMSTIAALLSIDQPVNVSESSVSNDRFESSRA